MTLRVVSAPWVLPGRAAERNQSAAPIPDGAVALDGNRVVAVGPRLEVEAAHGRGERRDAILLPALVNAHLHLELSHLKHGVAGGEGLPAWIQLLISTRAGARTREDAPEQAMAMAAEDLATAGVAAVGDVSNTLASVGPLARAHMAGTVFHEVFGFTPARFQAHAAAALAARAAAPPPPPGLRVVESPHAVYSTHREALFALLRAGPGSLHLAEDPAERLFVRDGTGPFGRLHAALGDADVAGLRLRGRSAVAAVAAVLRPHHLAVHCVDLDAEDVALLAGTGATAVLCPRSNAFISRLCPPLEALLAAGVPLAVGTDSLASSPSLAPLAELAVLAAAFPAVPASRLLSLAWNGPAVAAPHVGRLAPGRAPGVLAAPLGGEVPADPFTFLLARHGAGERPFSWLASQEPSREPGETSPGASEVNG
jgi:cytosine/adenosine deaminase-related metal-dependent hydrolase